VVKAIEAAFAWGRERRRFHRRDRHFMSRIPAPAATWHLSVLATVSGEQVMLTAHRLAWASTALLACGCIGSSVAADRQAAPEGNDLIAMHQKLYGQAAPTVSPDAATDAADTDIDLIGLQRTVCSAKCPTYSVVIDRSGRFRYTGVANVARLGSATGSVDPTALRYLVRYIDESRFDTFASGYVYNQTGKPSSFTWIRRGTTDKVVWNYGAAGPVKLWAIEALIDQLVATATWDPTVTAVASASGKAKARN
jgi:hypothetical protein